MTNDTIDNVAVRLNSLFRKRGAMKQELKEKLTL